MLFDFNISCVDVPLTVVAVLSRVSWKVIAFCDRLIKMLLNGIGPMTVNYEIKFWARNIRRRYLYLLSVLNLAQRRRDFGLGDVPNALYLQADVIVLFTGSFSIIARNPRSVRPLFSGPSGATDIPWSRVRRKVGQSGTSS